MRRQSKSQKSMPWIKTEESQGSFTLHVGGVWTFQTLGAAQVDLEKQISLLSLSKDIPVNAIVEPDCILDTAGACFFARLIKILESQGYSVAVKTNNPVPSLDRFLSQSPVPKPLPPLHRKIHWVEDIGYHTTILTKTFLSLVAFLGEILVTWYRTLHSPLRLRWVSVFYHAYDTGMKALPIVCLISFLIGIVLAYQSINQLSRFGAEIYTVDFLGISVLREIAVLLTALVVAGRSGSAFTAQIGTMVLNQEVDAIRIFGLNPILVLAIPRIIALMICLPILVFFSMILALFGGMVITRLIIDLPTLTFIQQLQVAISPGTFWVGMSKAPLFAILIGLVGSFRGFQVKGSAESVGKMTTQSVVESIFLVMVCDALMSILFSYLKV